MLIVFEGPDEVGKTTSSTNLSSQGMPIYNATKENYAQALVEQANAIAGTDHIITFDRIDWLTHLVYRLAMPDKEWNDERVRTVFAMPEAHLVLRFHPFQVVPEAEGEGYTELHSSRVNQGYYHLTDYISGMNHLWGFQLFKTVTALEVRLDPETGVFHQDLKAFVAPGFQHGTSYEKIVHDDESLLELLQYADERIG